MNIHRFYNNCVVSNLFFLNKNALLYFIFFVTLPTLASAIELVRNSQSRYLIYVQSNAPDSVVLAADELQSYVYKSTGALLPITREYPKNENNIISLGDNDFLAKYIKKKNLDYEHYDLRFDGDRIFIYGNDLENNKKTPYGGDSMGTLYGVYEFIERYLGIKWLMPGEVGEYVPIHHTLMLDGYSYSGGPSFYNRRIPYIQNENHLVKKWLLRNRQGYSVSLLHYHNFSGLVPPNEYDSHPDWFPLLGGKRVEPGDSYKLETTNQQLVHFVADVVANEFRSNSQAYTFSISPSDGEGWSESIESLMLYDKDKNNNVSYTSLVLKFYNDVAKTLQSEFPDKRVCGYIYSDYLYPPLQKDFFIEKNVCLVVAPHISYGYGLYKEKNRRDYEYILRSWSKTVDTIAYYDLPSIYIQSVGAPNPPAIDLLAYIYPFVHKQGYKGVYMYGSAAWGHAAMSNYILAKLNYNPSLDPSVIMDDFLLSAYGEKSAPHIKHIYNVLDTANRDFHAKNITMNYRFTQDVVRQLYLPIIHDISRSYNLAINAAVDDKNIARLNMLGMNLDGFVTYLHDIGLLQDAEKITIKTGAYKKYSGYELAMDPEYHNNDPLEFRVIDMKINLKKILQKIGLYKNANFDVTGYKAGVKRSSTAITGNFRGNNNFIFHINSKPTLKLNLVANFGENGSYRVISENGSIIRHGKLKKINTIDLSTIKLGGFFYLDVKSKSDIYSFEYAGIQMVIDANSTKQGVHFNGHIPDIRFFVGGDDKAILTIYTESIKESIALNLFSPDGKPHDFIDLSGRVSEKLVVDAKSGVGFWTVSWKKPKHGVVDDVWLKMDSNASGWLFVE